MGSGRKIISNVVAKPVKAVSSTVANAVIKAAAAIPGAQKALGPSSADLKRMERFQQQQQKTQLGTTRPPATAMPTRATLGGSGTMLTGSTGIEEEARTRRTILGG